MQEQLAAAISEERRTKALQVALTTGKAPVLPPLPLAGEGRGEGPTSQALTTQAQLLSEHQDIIAKLAKLQSEQARRQAEIATVSEAVAKLEATLPIAQQREADFKRLADQGFMSGHAGQDRTKERIEQERDLAM